MNPRGILAMRATIRGGGIKVGGGGEDWMIPRERYGIFVAKCCRGKRASGEEKKKRRPKTTWNCVGPTEPGEGARDQHATEIEWRPPRPSFSSPPVEYARSAIDN